MKSWRSMTWLRIASMLALLALGLITWSFLDPSPLLMVFVMSVGQGLGTLSLVIFVAVVVHDALLKRTHIGHEKTNQDK